MHHFLTVSKCLASSLRQQRQRPGPRLAEPRRKENRPRPDLQQQPGGHSVLHDRNITFRHRRRNTNLREERRVGSATPRSYSHQLHQVCKYLIPVNREKAK